MSLLLEALKKAEKAKEEAQKRAAENGAAPAQVEAKAPLELQKPEAASAEAKTVMTRPQLPDVSPSLEILSDDLAPQRAAAPARPASAPAASAAPRSQAAPRAGEPSAQRAAAKKVFEAKFKEANPRLPFYITLGVLGAFAVGTVGYFWYQLRPATPQFNANPPKPAGELVAVPARAPQTTSAGPVAAVASASIPGLPSAALPGAAAPAPEPAAPPPPPARKPAAVRPEPAPAPSAAPLVSRSDPERASIAVEVPAKVQSGYEAYASGNLAVARADYQDALRDNPDNRDALLGLAAIDLKTQNFGAAAARYERILEIDPRDPYAQAGLIALRSGRADPLVTESRVKSLLAVDRNAPVLNFTLGNELAAQGRWAEAQQEYSKAYAADPENADFAYNLAVSLDHLHQQKPALEYYQRALSLAGAQGGASFDMAAARGRAAQLGQ